MRLTRVLDYIKSSTPWKFSMEWKKELEQRGYTVIPSLTKEEVAFGIALFNRWHSENRVPVASHGNYI